MPSFPYMSQVYNSIPNAFREMTPMYADAPRLRYEKQKAEEQQAYNRALDAKKMAMAEQEFQAQQTARHLDNAVKLLKLGGAGAATGYLDKFTPGHGITVEGIGGGMYVAKGKGGRGGSGGSGGSGPMSIVVDPNNPSQAGVVIIGDDGVPKFRDDVAQKLMNSGYSNKERVALQGILSAARLHVGAKAKATKKPIVTNPYTGLPATVVYDENGDPSGYLDIPDNAGSDPAGTNTTPPEGTPAPEARPLPAGAPPNYRVMTSAPEPPAPPAGRNVGETGTPIRLVPSGTLAPPPPAPPAPAKVPLDQWSISPADFGGYTPKVAQ